jgi:hypothetical protein
MIKRNLLKSAAVFLSCCLVFTSAGCGKKSKAVTTESTTKVVTEQETKKNAGSEEQVTIAVKDSEGNTVEVAGIVETKDNGEKVVIIQDRDGNRKEIKADNFEEGDSNSIITITDETVAEEISEAVRDDKIAKADEDISVKPSTDVVADNDNNNNDSNSGSSSGSDDNNNGSNSSNNSDNSGNNGSSSSDNGSNSTPGGAETKPSTPSTPSHEHNWEPVYDYIPHEEVKEKVWVVDKAAWDEPVYTIVYVCVQCERGMCERCRSLGLEQVEFATNEDRKAHQYACLDSEDGVCMNSTTRKKITGYTHHDEEGHYETVTVSEAYVEQKLVGYKCSSCGETK